MEWLIGIGRSRLGGSSARKTGSPSEDSHKAAYLSDNYLNGQLISKVSKEELQDSVPVPAGVDSNEWLATHTLSFFNHLNLLYSSLSEYCTPSVCSTVSTGAPMSFTWIDEKGKKMRLSAPQYIELVIVHVQKYVTDENVFPTKYDMTFPNNFQTVVKKIFRLLFHVLVHIFQSHYVHCVELNEILLLNTLFIHFMYFQTEHGLLEAKEVTPLQDLVESLCL